MYHYPNIAEFQVGKAPKSQTRRREWPQTASLILAGPPNPSFASATGLKQPLLYMQSPKIPGWPARLASNGLSYRGKAPKSQSRRPDHVLLLREFFTVCQENHLRIKLEKCEFMKEEMEYLGFDVGYGWWKPAASKMQPLQHMQIRDDPKKGLHDKMRAFCCQSFPKPVSHLGCPKLETLPLHQC